MSKQAFVLYPTAFYLLRFVVTEEPLSKGNTGMCFRARRGSPRAGGAGTRFEIKKSKSRAGGTAGAAVRTPKPPTRPAGKSNCLDNPLGQAGERLGSSGALFVRAARCSFWP
jgi:hypothetical protein